MTEPVPPPTPTERVLVIGSLSLILIYCVIGIVVPAGLGWDFANFYDAGRRFAAGQASDLYAQASAIAGDVPQGQMRFWSAPLAAAFFAPLSVFRPEVALVVFKVQNTLALYLGLWLLYRHCRQFVPPDRQWHYGATFATMALLFQPFWTVFRVGGQSTPTVFLLLVLALTAHTRGRWFLSALLLSCSVALKPTLIVLLAFLVVVSPWPFTLALALAGGGLALTSIALTGWPTHLQFLRIVVEGSQTSRPWVFNSSLFVPLENFRLLPSTSPAAARVLGLVEWVLRLAVVAFFGMIVVRAPRDRWTPAARQHFAFLMAIGFWLLSSLLLWEHYLAALFIPVAFVTAVSAFSTRAQAVAMAIAVTALGQNLIAVMFIANRFDLTSAPALLAAGVAKAAPLILFLVLLVVHRRELYSAAPDTSLDGGRFGAGMTGSFPAKRLFFTCWLVYAVHWAPFMIREQFPAITLATRGTLNVDAFLGYTEDIFRGPRGGAFINNNPGASILGALPLLIARPALAAIDRWNATSPASFERSLHAERYQAPTAVFDHREWYIVAVAFLTAAGLMAPVSALSVVLFGRTLWLSGVKVRSAVAGALLYGFATPVFLRTSYLNHNLLVCHAGLFAALLLYDRDRRPLTVRHTLAAGAIAGYAVLCDFSGGIVLAVLGLYVLARAADGAGFSVPRTVRMGLWYTLGALPALLALLAYQQWAFGAAAAPSQQFMPAIQETAQGYRGFHWPSFELAWMNFFDPRFGLFAVCPLIALAFAAPIVNARTRRIPNREMWFIVALCAGMTLFCASNEYSRLQWRTGVRYLVPVIPGLMLLTLPVLAQLPRALTIVLVVVDGLMSWVTAAAQMPLLTVITEPLDFKLSWLRRINEYHRVGQVTLLSASVLLVVAAIVWGLWRSEWKRLSVVS